MASPCFNEKCLTIHEMIELLSITRETFYRWKSTSDFGTLKFVKKDGILCLPKKAFMDYIMDHLDNRDCVKIYDQQAYDEGLEFMSRVELSEKLKLHKWTLANWHSSGDATPHRVPIIRFPGDPKYRVVDVDMWLTKHLINYPPHEEGLHTVNLKRDTLLLPKEAGIEAGVCTHTLCRWQKSKWLPYIKLGSVTRYKLSDIKTARKLQPLKV